MVSNKKVYSRVLSLGTLCFFVQYLLSCLYSISSKFRVTEVITLIITYI